MVKNDRLRLELLNESTGEVLRSRALNNENVLKLTIPVDPIFKRNQFLIDGANCSTLDFDLNGALSNICHNYLHFDTLLLHKKDMYGNVRRLNQGDFIDVLDRGKSATKRYISRLVKKEALIKPSYKYLFFVSPRFKIRGGYISVEEFDMLLKHDPLIKNCLGEDQSIQFNNWKAEKELMRNSP